MGEAKRRKKLDPNYGKEESKISESISFFIDDDDDDDIYNRSKKDTLLTFNINYEARAIIYDTKEEIIHSGHIQHNEWARNGQYDDNYSVFSKALDIVYFHFYNSKLDSKSQNRHDPYLDDLTVRIKSLNVEYASKK